MDLQDRMMEWLLAALDRFMDRITLGAWTRVRGSVVPGIKVRRQRDEIDALKEQS